MEIIINTDFITEFFNLPVDEMLRRVLFYFGWIPIAVVLLWGLFQIWLYYIAGKWGEKNAKYTILAIDIPRGNEQSPKAVENLFSYLAGAHGTINLIEKYWEGKYQLGFSFEIVSIEGYTQFMIHTPVGFRDLVESAVYSQYPDAEITEVDDYTAEYSNVRFPSDEYDLWGAEFIQAKSPALPIKTYKEFEHQFGEPETHFKDPMATLMDLMSTLKKGEQLWYQIIIIPIAVNWTDICDKEVSKMLGEASGGGNIFGGMADFVLGLINSLLSGIFGSSSEEAPKKEADPLKMMNLKPKQKKKVEAIEAKSGQFAFDFKIRMVYLAKKEAMQKSKVVNGFVGYMKQFAALDMNNLKPDMNFTGTTTSYLFSKKRLARKKNNIFKNYIDRNASAGRAPGIMNVEELATIWHFPNESVVKASMIQKAPGRKAEPPMALPQSEELVGENISEPLFLNEDNDGLFESDPVKEEKTDKSSLDEMFFDKEENEESPRGAPPANLPFA